MGGPSRMSAESDPVAPAPTPTLLSAAGHRLARLLKTVGGIVAKMATYHRQQNKCYHQGCLLAHFEVTLDFSRSEFTLP